jgi:uncharacterized membrane protein YfcA
LTFLEQLILLVISLLANTLSSLSGGGAGLLQLPALIFLGLPFATALATHKVATVALGIGASAKHLRSSVLNLRFSLLLLISGLPGVLLGADLVLDIPAAYAKIALGVITVLLGVYSWVNPTLGLTSQPRFGEGARFYLGAIVLCIIGVINGSLASGSGLMVTLWLVYWYGLDFKRAAAYTMVLVGLFWNGAGALSLAMQTPLAWAWLPALLVGSLVGGFLGAKLVHQLASRRIKTAYELVTLAVGISLIVDGVS